MEERRKCEGPLFPFEEQINATVLDLLKSKAAVEVEGWVEFLDMNGDRLARRARFLLQLTQ